MEAPAKHSNRKRHTKPCTFYQSMQCPFSADECDFAHVFTNDMSKPQTPQPNHKSKVCRYFAAGSCAQGMWCRFKHPADDELGYEEPVYDPVAAEDALTGGNMRKKPGKRPSPFIAVPAISPGYFPAPSWSPYPNSAGSPYPGVPPGFYIPNNLLTPSGTHDYIDPSYAMPDTPSSSDHSSDSSDDLVVTMDDLHLSNRPPPQPSMLPPPPMDWTQMGHQLPHPGAMPMGYYAPASAPVGMPTPGPPLMRRPSIAFSGSQASSRPSSRAARERSQSQPMPKSKAAAFKTKPCKFFKPDSVCPSGDKCTFIHDASGVNVYQHKKEASISSDTSSSVQSHESPVKLPPDLPAKPVSIEEENKKKGYFPISWRVIGGGVTLGGKRPICQSHIQGQCGDGDDCEFLHDGAPHHTSKSMITPMLLVPEDSVTPTAANFRDGSTYQSTSKLYDAGTDDSDNDDYDPEAEAARVSGLIPKASIKQRPTSMSIPATPKPDFSRLFSNAESPGGL